MTSGFNLPSLMSIKSYREYICHVLATRADHFGKYIRNTHAQVIYYFVSMKFSIVL